MNEIARPLRAAARLRPPPLDARAATAAAFVLLFWTPAYTLVRDWWSDPEAAHGLLLAPLSVWLAVRTGVRPDARGAPVLGALMLAIAVVMRWVAELAAEVFTLRAALLLGAAGVVVTAWGVGQVVRWWLPASLLALSVPLPDVVLGTVALPLQLRASAMGAALLEWRHVPVLLDGNVIRLPSRTLFVTEACSGLRSLAALLSLGLLIGGLWLARPLSRALLVLLAIPVAVLLNGVRVFLTGFLVHFVSPAAGDGIMHMTEGWVMFVAAFGILCGCAALLNLAESRWPKGAR